MIKIEKSTIGIPLIVGGGIKTGEQVKEVVEAGANIIVTGNVLEEYEVKGKIRELVKSMKRP